MSVTKQDQLTAITPGTQYYLATYGSRTRMGGVIVGANTSGLVNGEYLAWVGDRVRYPDGSESTIVSGAGNALAYNGKPAAIIGSITDNGDTVISSLQSVAWIQYREGNDSICGFLQTGYTATVPCPMGES